MVPLVSLVYQVHLVCQACSQEIFLRWLDPREKMVFLGFKENLDYLVPLDQEDLMDCQDLLVLKVTGERSVLLVLKVFEV